MAAKKSKIHPIKGEPMVWLSGGAMIIGIVMILSLIALIVINGSSTFWPGDVEKYTLGDGSVVVGQVHNDRELDIERGLPLRPDGERYRSYELDDAPTEIMVRRGNQDPSLYNGVDQEAYVWLRDNIPDHEHFKQERPDEYASVIVDRERMDDNIVQIERLSGGVLLGYVVRVTHNGKVLADKENDGDEKVWEVFLAKQEEMYDLYKERYSVQKHDIGDVNADLKDIDDELKELAYDNRESREMVVAFERLQTVAETWIGFEPMADPETKEAEFTQSLNEWHTTLKPALDKWQTEIDAFDLTDDQRATLSTARELTEKHATILVEQFSPLRAKVVHMTFDETQATYTFRTFDDKEAELPVGAVIRAYKPNQLGFFGRLGIWFAQSYDFLTEDPRESNTEGGIFPAIVGTLVMTLLMTLVVVPFGVIAALYLREYAKQGPLVSAVRIAVNNLAGVPSIVFGIFGLGFFCITMGGTIDSIFYPEQAPSPVFGGGGIMWASLTLALLTVPVVIVATEEALSAVPSSQREASLGCGASKWQTIRKIIIPQALPGILTGAILAMARGAGEVAPLMLVGAVKYAPYMPADGTSPFIHLDRQFMHLGFHIFDMGYQSPNVSSTKPLVFATALVLIVMVAVLNVFAIAMRNHLRKKFRTSHV